MSLLVLVWKPRNLDSIQSGQAAFTMCQLDIQFIETFPKSLNGVSHAIIITAYETEIGRVLLIRNSRHKVCVIVGLRVKLC